MCNLSRLTDGFSKNAYNQVHMVALYTTWYNFVRMRGTFRCSPALAAKVSNRLWSMGDIVALMDARQPPAKRPTTYCKRITV